MASFFSSAWLDELRDRIDIVSVIGEHVQLTQKGRDYWGLCPFHGEKSPSFKVDAARQFYHCFGCHAGGDVFRFVSEMERLDFPETVRMLAERTGLPLPKDTRAPEDYAAARSLKEQIYDLNKKAATFFHEQLWQKASAPLLSYLYERGLDDATLRKFGLGATAPGWDALTTHLLAEGTSAELLRQAGLSSLRDERQYDMFRQRVMFPIIDATGRVLGFGGRAMGDVQPKYLNSPDTPVFNKRLGVYGVHLLRKQRNLSRLLLVEGYMDVVALSQYGLSGVVATLGTALSVEQAALLKRYAPQVHIAYDGDKAGQNATLRALDIFEAENVPCRVLVIPGGEDPDEFIRQHGREVFEAIPPMHPVLYRMARAQEKYDLSSKEARTNYAIEAAGLIARIAEPVERENCLEQLMLETGFTHEVLLAQVESSPGAKQSERKSATQSPARKLKHLNALEGEEHLRAERTLLCLMCGGHIESDVASPEDFDTPLYRRLAQAWLEGAKPVTLLESTDDEAERAEILQMLEALPKGVEQHALDVAAGCLRQIHAARLIKQIQTLQQEAAQAPPERRAALLSRIAELIQKSKDPDRKEGSI